MVNAESEVESGRPEANPRPGDDFRRQYPRVHFFQAYPYGPDTVIRFVESEGEIPEGQKFWTGVNTVYYLSMPGAQDGGVLTTAARASLVEVVKKAVRGRRYRVYLHIAEEDGLFIWPDGSVGD